jgi:hypothetical protein
MLFDVKRLCLTALLISMSSAVPAAAKTVVFWQQGFPTVDSQPVTRQSLEKALPGAAFTDLAGLCGGTALTQGDLLVLPYGSAFPVACWSRIDDHLHHGGNLLVLGGEPFEVPVSQEKGSFVIGRRQPSFARQIGLRNAYEVPAPSSERVMWREGYEFLPAVNLRARRYFTLEGPVEGLGFIDNAQGEPMAAPVAVSNHADKHDKFYGARIVALDFDPETGFWDSADGLALLQSSAAYASRGATAFTLETRYAALPPGEAPSVTVKLQLPAAENGAEWHGTIHVSLFAGDKLLEQQKLSATGPRFNSELQFAKTLPQGFYILRARCESGGQTIEVTANGFWIADEATLRSGPKLGTQNGFLTRDGQPFFPAGMNYFTTDNTGWEFDDARNALVWEQDFAEMERNGVNFVRTGVWSGAKRFLDPKTGGANERFLRNLEALLLSARRHGIAVNFTFFAFAPQAGQTDAAKQYAPANPYLDEAAVHAEEAYVASVAGRFKDLPYLSWDLINEPSFSNPRRPWKGNTPNRDSVELAAWREWLRQRYGSIEKLADAWTVTPQELGGFDKVPLPSNEDLAPERSGSTTKVRAFDYNLFAQVSFAGWVTKMVETIRSTGSTQMINVGHDEGGVLDRPLNHFFAGAGVNFTTNHTYWQDDNLLWDTIASRVPGIPNIVGETGYQPYWSTDGTWFLDEFNGRNLLERKWVLGFAGGSSGAVHWDWDREPDFGTKRSDRSNKTFIPVFRGVAEFARAAAPYATALTEPEIAIILPQSEQLGVDTRYATEASQKALSALYSRNRASAYFVGEYQLQRLGSPKLIIVPSPNVFDAQAWETLAAKVREGATLLVSGDFARDAHTHRNGAEKILGLSYAPAQLGERSQRLTGWQGEALELHYSAEKGATLSRAVLDGGTNWTEQALGKGRVLFSALPLELSDNLETVGAVYGAAIQTAGVRPVYTTEERDTNVLIVPAQLPHATLYVIVSESMAQTVGLTDARSGKSFHVKLEAGRAAMAVIGEDGRVLASYNWNE